MSEKPQEVSNIEGASNPEIQAFKNLLSKADGTLYPLKKRTKDGKQLYITARQIFSPEVGGTENVNPLFFKWQQLGENRADAVLLIDVYVGTESGRELIGRRDWWMNGEYASGAGNMHDAVLPSTDYENTIGNSTSAFKVADDYQRQNIGSLMLATSAVVLPALGVREFSGGVLLEPAQKTFARFDIEEEDYISSALHEPLPIERLSGHPGVEKLISEFVLGE
ncbi:MAG: hypothetical protein KBD05_02855 [Candidatus Pacebacteria bacterium]|nr:hypothetical protein [Candidatus Paceibacterota bacterium]